MFRIARRQIDLLLATPLLPTEARFTGLNSFVHAKRTVLQKLRVAGVVSAGFCLSACGNFFSIHHQFDPATSKGISIDAKQRVVYAVRKEYPSGKSWLAVCAEPSPDALSALSASAGVDFGTLNKAIALAAGGQEGAASIGLRTQTIQMLRDSMYRLCEAYASGAIDNIGYSKMQRRYQDVMLGLLAIEQLTGVVSARQVALSGQSEARAAKSLSDINKALDEAKEIQKKAGDKLTERKASKEKADGAVKVAKEEYDKAAKAAGDDETKKAAAEALKKTKLDSALAAAKTEEEGLAAATAEAADAKSAVDSMAKARDSFERVAAKQIINAEFSGGSVASTINKDTVASIADAVVKIVAEVSNREYSLETCLEAIAEASSPGPRTNGQDSTLLLKYCAALLAVKSNESADTKSKERATNAVDALSREIAQMPKSAPSAQDPKTPSDKTPASR